MDEYSRGVTIGYWDEKLLFVEHDRVVPVGCPLSSSLETLRSPTVNLVLRLDFQPKSVPFFSHVCSEFYWSKSAQNKTTAVPHPVKFCGSNSGLYVDILWSSCNSMRCWRHQDGVTGYLLSIIWIHFGGLKVGLIHQLLGHCPSEFPVELDKPPCMTSKCNADR